MKYARFWGIRIADYTLLNYWVAVGQELQIQKTNIKTFLKNK